MAGIDVEKPVLQVLSYKKLARTVNKDGVDTDRYRLLVSDGQKLNSFTMLATQLNNLITDSILTENAICRILNYHLSSVSNGGREKPVLLILGIEVLVPGSEVGHKIGDPTNLEVRSKAESTFASTGAIARYQINGSARKDTSSHFFSDIYSAWPTPIAALSPYQNRWVVKVRVTSKSPIKTWSNSRGEGKLFSMGLIDESGEIRCVAFRDMCDKFYDRIQCTLKMANKQFNTLKNDYEMVITRDTVIIPCYENNDDIPTLQFNFCPISQVENKEQNEFIDVLGVVTTFSDVQRVVQRSTGREFIKRDVNIVDDSGTMVSVALWEKQAKDFDGSNNPVLAIKGARVGEFNGGKNLSLIHSSVLEKNPDLPEAHRLREWYTTVGHSENARSLSRAGGSGDLNVPLYTLQEATEARLGEKMNISDAFMVVATNKIIRVENAIYKACPIESCKKKLIDQSTGVFRCEKCNKEYPNFSYRLLASMNIVDATGNRWVTAFGEEAEKILGISAQHLGELKESDNDAYLHKFGEATFKRFTFNLRAKSEVFQDEMRIQYVCVSVTPLNYKTYLAHLIDKVSKLLHIEKFESN
ncbi:PREDICTED: replication protein A 70 kDa DNA-binding subunit-like isoform X2 [Vollenhovia emeryi]|uniref:replication protein A 70 kDa DNA-binding subunit-like isoform X2 n=1 Tax=Vollenhovia emeryi TaxID=411798 RepID=UPI0005F416B7|nr:PREDICTED: replication protein A 70 kDa DNA-binding subunit-like isoform X2 [Vollenhovia emeryi]